MRKKLLEKKNALRVKRKRRVRGKISGTAQKPRVTIYRSNKYIYAQAINDVEATTLAAVDGNKLTLKNKTEDATKVAKELAERLKSKKIETVVFDRNGYIYHGVVAAFADSLRENGISF